MTIIKIKQRGQRSSRSFRVAPKDIDDDDVDGSDLSDSGCELAMVGNQICNVPYDLYFLSGLKYVLSIETWNSCLTEEERFNLSAYLPDMDHDSFVLTMQELLNGNIFSFDSPIETFFERMKSGFYSLQVTPERENLRNLQKCKYYHSLQIYHDNMNKKFLDMKEAWRDCVSSTTVEEKIQRLKKKDIPKPLLLVDLNALPQEDESSDSTFVENVRVNRKAKAKGKGVMKTRPVEMNLLSNFACKRMPKGVLKIKPRGDFGMVEKPITIPFPQVLGWSDTYKAKEQWSSENWPYDL